jgi:hypothetical protein
VPAEDPLDRPALLGVCRPADQQLVGVVAEADRDARDGGRVLEQHRLRRRVAAAADELDLPAVGLLRVLLGLANRAGERDALGNQR